MTIFQRHSKKVLQSFQVPCFFPFLITNQYINIPTLSFSIDTVPSADTQSRWDRVLKSWGSRYIISIHLASEDELHYIHKIKSVLRVYLQTENILDPAEEREISNENNIVEINAPGL